MISEAVATTRAGKAVAVRNRFAGSWSLRFPAINGSGLHLIRQGSPWLLTDDAAPVQVSPGDVVFLPHGPPHAFSHEPGRLRDVPARGGRTAGSGPFAVDFDSCCYHLDRGQVHESFAGLPAVLVLNADDRYPALRALTSLLGEHAEAGRPGDDIALPAVVDLLLVHLLRAWHEQGVLPGSPDPRIADVLLAVGQDPHKPWTVRQLSDLARLPRGAFTRRFTDATGETPGAYLLRRRLDQGAQLLRYTALPLASIASQLGYATEFSFSAAFTRRFGIAPGRFRQRSRSSAD